VPRKGIVVNLAEMRLYYFGRLNGRRVVSTYPIGVGLEGFNTPLGKYSISMKMVRPSWFVPFSIRKENPSLPRIMPPGEDNPLGEYALQLKGTAYFIHGTNNPFGIGRRVSHGCIRLYPNDIKELFFLVRRGTPVRVIYQPVKVAYQGGEVFIEVHKDYQGRAGDLEKKAKTLLRKRGLLGKTDIGLLRKAVDEALGYPVRVTKGTAPVMEAGAERESG
jgi:L,D-transpeptidase ErfK/SrfK